MRVVYNLCKEWEKMEAVELTVLSKFLNLQIPIIKPWLVPFRVRLKRFDVLNTHGVSETAVKATKLCKEQGIPTIYTAHGAAFKENQLGYKYSKEFIKSERKLVSLSDKIVSVSPIIRNLLMREYELPEDKFKVIYNGINPSWRFKGFQKINIRKRYKIPDNRKIILNVGGTRTVKDIYFLITALELLKRKDWHLVLVGKKGDIHKEVMEKCNSKIPGHYNFAGRVSEHELLNFYQQSDLLVVASKYEPFGLSPLEAMSCGTPAAVRSTAGISHLLEENIFETPQELKDIITRYLDINKEIDFQRFKKILYRNSWNKRAYDYLELFRELTCVRSD